MNFFRQCLLSNYIVDFLDLSSQFRKVNPSHKSRTKVVSRISHYPFEGYIYGMYMIIFLEVRANGSVCEVQCDSMCKL